MAKLIFKYGAMNSGKTTVLLQTAYNYEERDQRVIVLKPGVDTKGNDKIVSRLKVERKVDYIIGPDDKIIDMIEDEFPTLNCILVDEAQFMSKKQAYELYLITKLYDIPVIAYGLRNDYRQNGFEGSSRILELADEIDELTTICRCGKKARFNGRKLNGEWTVDGNQVEIDDGKKYTYESVCGECYLHLIKGYPKIKQRKKED